MKYRTQLDTIADLQITAYYTTLRLVIDIRFSILLCCLIDLVIITKAEDKMAFEQNYSGYFILFNFLESKQETNWTSPINVQGE